MRSESSSIPMKLLAIIIFTGFGTVYGQSYPFNGYLIYDYLVSATHPNGCNPDFVLGPPDDSTWVNLSDFTVMTGFFGMGWSDQPGDELLLETSYHRDNYSVRLILSGGAYSDAVAVNMQNWIEVPQVDWMHIYFNCDINFAPSSDWILPMDFVSFGLSAADIVTGIEITFLPTLGQPDLAGVYIIVPPCLFIDLGPDVIICPGETIDIDAYTPDATYEWQDGSTEAVYPNAGPGQYWVMVTVDDCTRTDTLYVIEAEVPLDIGDDLVLCPGETTQLDATTPGATYEWHDGSSQPTNTVTEEGLHGVIIEVNGCLYGDTLLVTYTDMPEFSLGMDTLMCEGATLLLDATLPGAEYTWHNQQHEPEFLVTSPGTYSVTITIDDCAISDEIDVEYVYLEPVDLGADQQLCSGQTILLDATTPDATYEWQDGSYLPIFEVNEVGTYWVNVNLYGCLTSDTVEVEYAWEVGPDLGSDFTLCPGESATLDAGTPGAIYLWQDMSMGSTMTVTNAGTYSVTVTTGDCTFSDEVVVSSISDLSTYLGPDTTLCTGAYLILDATTPLATYQWQDMTTGSTMHVSQPGTYWVEVTLDHCTASDTIEVQYAASIHVDLGMDTTLCPGETIRLEATAPGASYLWQDQTSDSTFAVVAPGIYVVTVAVGNCSASDSIQIQYADTLEIHLGNDTTLCQGENIILDASTPGADFVWQDLSTSSSFMVAQPGDYWVLATLQGCTASDTIQVTYLTLANSILGPDTTLCEGETLVLDAQNPGAAYLWQDLSSQSTLQVDQQGTYWVDVSLNQCSVRDSILVEYTTFTPVGLGPDTTVCPGATMLLEVTILGATVLWQDLSTGTSQLVSSPGMYWAAIEVDGCIDTDTILISHASLPSIGLGPDTTLCAGDTLLLDAGPIGDTYLWQDHTTDQTWQVTQPGSYWAEVVVGECAVRDSIDVAYLTISSLSLGEDTTLCEGASLILDVSTPGASYLWQDNSTLPVTTVSQPGQYRVTVRVGTCQASDTIDVYFVETSPVDLGPDTTLCKGQTLTLHATPAGASYIWQDGSTQSQLLVFTEGTYSVFVLQDHCVSADTIQVGFIDMPVINLGGDTSLCPGTTLTLATVETGTQYLWSDNSTGETLTISQPGLYWLQMSQHQCRAADTILIDMTEAVLFDLGADTILCRGETLLLDPAIDTDVDYKWQDFTSGPTLIASEAGLYWLHISDPCGMTADSISVDIENCDCRLFAPNIFTPDGDQVNDLFIPQVNCALTSYQFRIFDRVGGLLFETNTWDMGWDGKADGKPVQVGVYVYVLRYAFEDGEMRSMYGDVTVIR